MFNIRQDSQDLLILRFDNGLTLAQFDLFCFNHFDI